MIAAWMLSVVAVSAQAQGFSGAEGFIKDLGLIRAQTADSAARFQQRRAADVPPRNADEAREAVWARLSGSGVPRDFVNWAFADPRVRTLREVEEGFGRPSESLPYERYRAIFITPARIEAGRRFLAERRGDLEAVSGRYGVDPGLLAALVGVESFYGTAPGRIGVFNALYTAITRVPARSGWAVRELAEFLKAAHEDKFDPQSVKGSYAGAFGWAQFIPSSFRAYAVDFDGDGRRRWDEWPDVLATAANYIARHGYDPGGSFEPGSKNWKAIYAYNHSENYVKVVIELRAALLAAPPPPDPASA